MRTVVGGTFDILHRGHRLLLDATAKGATAIHVGLVGDEMGQTKVSRPFSERELTLRAYLLTRTQVPVEIVELSEPFGESVRGDFDRIMASPETLARCAEINTIRVTAGLAPLDIQVVDHVRAQDGRPISSTRIKAGECDGGGLMLRPLLVGVGSQNEVKVGAVADAWSIFPGDIAIGEMAADGGLPEQPWGDQVVAGARARAQAVMERSDPAPDYAIGIEAGLWEFSPGDDPFQLDIQVCVILDASGRETRGFGPGFAYPPEVVEAVRGGLTVGAAMAEREGREDFGQAEGAIGVLSHGWLDRRRLTFEGVRAALIPRMDDLLAGRELGSTLAEEEPPGSEFQGTGS